MNKQSMRQTTDLPGNRISRMVVSAQKETWKAVAFGIGVTGVVMHSIIIAIILIP